MPYENPIWSLTAAEADEQVVWLNANGMATAGSIYDMYKADYREPNHGQQIPPDESGEWLTDFANKTTGYSLGMIKDRRGKYEEAVAVQMTKDDTGHKQ
jgi:hypothetical protein